MGEARRRGTFEERRAKAKPRQPSGDQRVFGTPPRFGNYVAALSQMMKDEARYRQTTKEALRSRDRKGRLVVSRAKRQRFIARGFADPSAPRGVHPTKKGPGLMPPRRTPRPAYHRYKGLEVDPRR